MRGDSGSLLEIAVVSNRDVGYFLIEIVITDVHGQFEDLAYVSEVD